MSYKVPANKRQDFHCACCVPHASNLTLQQHSEVGNIITIPILQTRKLRLREDQCLA